MKVLKVSSFLCRLCSTRIVEAKSLGRISKSAPRSVQGEILELGLERYRLLQNCTD